VGETSPNFFVIGAARSGTTALAEMLRQHPDVFLTQPKEPHFLAFAGQEVAFTGNGDDQSVNRAAVTDVDAYLALYESAGGCAARGDASVSTLYYPRESLEALDRYFPDARLVAILREPSARAFSAFSYLRVRGFEPCDDFRDALDLEAERAAAGWHHLWHYVEMGRYAGQLEPFVEELGPDRLQLLFYDDLCRDPAATVRRVFEFLGVDAGVAVSCERVNASGSPRSAVLQAGIRWTARPGPVREAIKALTPFRLRERVRGANLGRDVPPPDAKEQLGEIFAPELARLRSLLARHYPDLLAGAPAWVAAAEPAVVSR
jgi:hypothetical protein